jgi:hypothetical protein
MTGWSIDVRNLAVSAVLVLLVVPSTRAQTVDPDAARQEIGELKRTVDQLNTRIEGLERRLDQPAQPTPQSTAQVATRSDTPTPAAGTTPQERWRKIEHGMPVEQVEALLGPPQRTVKIEAKTLWYYSYPEIGSGSIVFVQDGGVVDWQPPPFSVWWW